MELQHALVKSPRTDMIVEVVQMISGILLVLFLWTHMIFVGSILVGANWFNALAHFMDEFGLVPATIVLLILIIGSHVGAVIRRMPRQWREQRIVWKHAKLIHHSDTWSWVFQVITGSALLILAIVHMAVVAFGGINSSLSASRVQDGFLIFYIVLLVLSEYHASVGLYRIFVKWGWVSRHSLKRVLGVISLITVVIGGATLWVFFTLGGVHA